MFLITEEILGLLTPWEQCDSEMIGHKTGLQHIFTFIYSLDHVIYPKFIHLFISDIQRGTEALANSGSSEPRLGMIAK